MKNLNPSRLLPLFAALLLGMATSCEKDPDNAVKLSYPNENIDYIESTLANEQPSIQTFTVNANMGASITGQKGTQIYIPSNAFVTENGSPVSGSVNFELQEIFSAADMITSGKMTSSEGRILASGGEMYINATQGSSQLKLAQGKSLSFKVPTDNYQSDMGLFVGNGGDGDNFDWVSDPATTVSGCQDSSSVTLFSYCFSIDSLINWINCDYFYNDPRPLTEIEIQVPQGYDNTNTKVYVYIPSINSVAQANAFQNGSFYINAGYRMPVGLAVTFIGVHYDGTNLFYSIQNATIVNNHVEVLSFQQVTAAQLAQILASL